VKIADSIVYGFLCVVTFFQYLGLSLWRTVPFLIGCGVVVAVLVLSLALARSDALFPIFAPIPAMVSFVAFVLLGAPVLFLLRLTGVGLFIRLLLWAEANVAFYGWFFLPRYDGPPLKVTSEGVKICGQAAGLEVQCAEPEWVTTPTIIAAVFAALVAAFASKALRLWPSDG
jgi:hypothetical protein